MTDAGIGTGDAPIKDNQGNIVGYQSKNRLHDEIKGLFNAPANRQIIFSGNVSVAVGEHGQQAVHVGEDFGGGGNSNPSGFSGYPWIAYYLDNTGNPADGYDVAMGSIDAGNASAPSSIAQFALKAENPSFSLRIKNLVGGDLAIEMEDRMGGGSVTISSLAADTLGLDLKLFTLEVPNASGCGSRNFRILGAEIPH